MSGVGEKFVGYGEFSSVRRNDGREWDVMVEG
jgi:hypothetical protein